MCAAPGIRTRVLSVLDREVPILRGMRKKSPTICDLRTADRLSPHHDSQFSAFSTEVLIRFRPGHNGSSSMTPQNFDLVLLIKILPGD